MTDAEILDLITSAERSAGQLMLDARHIIAEAKTDARNVVTAYDRKVQEMLIAALCAALPGAHFFCEESDHPDSLNAEYVFVIDPIDGTMNFVRGLHHSCISVACLHEGAVTAAAIYNPYMDEMFTALAGQGARLNGRPITCAADDLAHSVVCFGTSPYYHELTETTFALIRCMYDHSLDIRREGAAALDLCTVAAGRAGLFFEAKLSLWDFAAGYLIVTEAGGRCCRLNGAPFTFTEGKASVLAGTKQAVEDFLSLTSAITEGLE